MSARAYAAVVLLAIALGVALHSPSLATGFAADDYLQRAMLDGSYPVARSPLDLYSFVKDERELARLIETGTLPWWSDPSLELSALRPLASLLIVLDERWLGLSPRAQHVHSLLWLAGLIGAFGLLAREIVRPRLAAFGVLLFAIDPAHVMPVAWLANRGALASACFGTLALLCHIRWRARGWRAGCALSALGFCLSLACGEYGLSFVAYVLGYELVAGSGALGRRLIASASVLVPALAYLTLHALLGYGAKGSAVYVDPLASPIGFGLVLLIRLPVLALAELTSIPPEMLHALSFATGIAGVSVMIALVAAAAWLFSRALGLSEDAERRKLAAFALGALVALIPLAGTLPSARLLVIPSIGGSLVLAYAIGLPFLLSARARGLRVAAGGLALVLALAHLVVAPLSALIAAIGWGDLSRRMQSTYLASPLAGAASAPDVAVIVNAVEPMSVIYPPYVLREHGRAAPRVWRALSITHRHQVLERLDERTLELRVEGGGMFEDPLSTLFRALEHPLAAGTTLELPDVEVNVLEVADWGPKRVRYRFQRSLDDPSIVIVMVDRGALRRLSPLPIGRPRPIPPG